MCWYFDSLWGYSWLLESKTSTRQAQVMRITRTGRWLQWTIAWWELIATPQHCQDENQPLTSQLHLLVHGWETTWSNTTSFKVKLENWSESNHKESFFKGQWNRVWPWQEGAHGWQSNTFSKSKESTNSQETGCWVVGCQRSKKSSKRPKGHSPSHHSFSSISVNQRSSNHRRKYVSP